MHEDIEKKPDTANTRTQISVRENIEKKLDALDQRISCLEEKFAKNAGAIDGGKSQNACSRSESESKMDRQIYQVIDSMDFDRIHSVMEFLDWQWIFGGYARVPSAEEIRRNVIELFEDVKNELLEQEFDGDSREYSISTGGLRATIEEWQDGNCWVHLEFVLEDHEADSCD